MAFSPAVPLVPSLGEDSPRTAPKRPHGTVAPVKSVERWRVPGRFGDMHSGRLTGILWTLDRGYLEDWADLTEYAISTDADLQSLYTSAITRVTQATWQVKPNKYGNQSDAQLAAELCDEMLGRMHGWRHAQTTLLHALALGYQPMEKEWETDRVSKKNLVRRLHFRHGHRFRLDTQYQYRLYDWGQAGRLKYSPYGQVLDPNRWIVHKHQAVAGYPTTAGLMRAGIWIWMFKRWTEKGYVRVLEKNGAPYLYIECTPDTPQAVRDEMKDFLEDLHTEKAAVVEAGGEIKVVQGSTITGTPLHDLFLKNCNATYAKQWLGSSDLVDPGFSGSNAAVNTRAGATADPRMVVYGIELGETTSDQLFRQVLEMNRHLFGGRLAPTPTYEANTASDEVQLDKQALIEQSGIKRGALDEEMKTAGSDAAPSTGTPDPTPAPAEVPLTASDPKALTTLAASESAPPKRKRSSRKLASSLAQTTLPISSHSARLLAETLRGVSDDPEP